MVVNNKINVQEVLKLYKVLGVFSENFKEIKDNKINHPLFISHSNKVSDVVKIEIYKKIDMSLNELEESERDIINFKYLGETVLKDDIVYNSLDIKRYKYYEIKKSAFLKIKNSL